MEATAKVQISSKGIEEVNQRKFKLDIKSRSVLILLTTPKTVHTLLEKTVYPPNEIVEAIRKLEDDGFITVTNQTKGHRKHLWETLIKMN